MRNPPGTCTRKFQSICQEGNHERHEKGKDVETIFKIADPKATGYRLGLLVNFGHYPKVDYECIVR